MADTQLTPPGWLLVCESQRHWTAALKTALASGPDCQSLRVRTVDQLPPLAALLANSTPLIVLLQIDQSNLLGSLRRMAAIRSSILIKTIALVERHLDQPSVSPKDQSFEPPAPNRRAMLDAALREAGAVLTIRSPRQIERVLPIARRHFAQAEQHLAQQLSPQEQIWRALPWQSADGPLG